MKKNQMIATFVASTVIIIVLTAVFSRHLLFGQQADPCPRKIARFGEYHDSKMFFPGPNWQVKTLASKKKRVFAVTDDPRVVGGGFRLDDNVKFEMKEVIMIDGEISEVRWHMDTDGLGIDDQLEFAEKTSKEYEYLRPIFGTGSVTKQSNTGLVVGVDWRYELYGRILEVRYYGRGDLRTMLVSVDAEPFEFIPSDRSDPGWVCGEILSVEQDGGLVVVLPGFQKIRYEPNSYEGVELTATGSRQDQESAPWDAGTPPGETSDQ